MNNDDLLIEVFKVSPDPSGTFDYIVVGSIEDAAKLAAQAVEYELDEWEPSGDAFEMTVRIEKNVMLKSDFDNLPTD